MTNIKNTDPIVVSNGVGRLKNNLPEKLQYGFESFFSDYTDSERTKILKLYGHELIADTPVTVSATYELEYNCHSNGACSNCSGIPCCAIFVPNEAYNDFEQTAIANSFHTDAPDDEYLLSDFGDVQRRVQFYRGGKFEPIPPTATEADYTKHGWKVVSFRSLTQPKPVEQPEVKVHYAESLDETILSIEDVSEASMRYAVQRGLDSVASISFIHGSTWSDQRHAAEREVLVKRVQELESDMQRIIHETHSKTKAYQIATEALSQKD